MSKDAGFGWSSGLQTTHDVLVEAKLHHLRDDKNP